MLLAAIGIGLMQRKEFASGARQVARWRVAIVLVVLALTLLAGAAKVYRLRAWAAGGTIGELTRVFREHAKGRPIAAFSYECLTKLYPAINYSGARWTGRFSQFWPLAGVRFEPDPVTGGFPYRSRSEMGEVEREVFDSVLASVLDKKDPPVLLLLDDSANQPSAGGELIDYVKYFSVDPRFAAAWRRYRFLTQVGDFRIFKRTPETPDAS